MMLHHGICRRWCCIMGYVDQTAACDNITYRDPTWIWVSGSTGYPVSGTKRYPVLSGIRYNCIASIIRYTSKHRDDQFSLAPTTTKDLESSLNSHVLLTFIPGVSKELCYRCYRRYQLFKHPPTANAAEDQFLPGADEERPACDPV